MRVVLVLPPVPRKALREVAEEQRRHIIEATVLQRLMMAEFVREPSELLPHERQHASGRQVPAVVLQKEHDGHHRGRLGALLRVEFGLCVHEAVAMDALSQRFEALHNLLLLQEVGFENFGCSLANFGNFFEKIGAICCLSTQILELFF